MGLGTRPLEVALIAGKFRLGRGATQCFGAR